MSRTALVYRGRASCEGCSEALADLLRLSGWGFEIRFVGDREEVALRPENLAGAALYAQPGGGNSVRRAYRQMKRYGQIITDYVGSGGRYLGICMGGYLAGHWRGFRLVPEDTEQFIASPGADVVTNSDTLVDVDWRGGRHQLFFQDGPLFRVSGAGGDVTVLARYTSNQEIAAMVCSYGRGRVGVCGPHPEAPPSWYEAHGLPRGEETTALGLDLVDTLMR